MIWIEWSGIMNDYLFQALLEDIIVDQLLTFTLTLWPQMTLLHLPWPCEPRWFSDLYHDPVTQVTETFVMTLWPQMTLWLYLDTVTPDDLWLYLDPEIPDGIVTLLWPCDPRWLSDIYRDPVTRMTLLRYLDSELTWPSDFTWTLWPQMTLWHKHRWLCDFTLTQMILWPSPWPCDPRKICDLNHDPITPNNPARGMVFRKIHLVSPEIFLLEMWKVSVKGFASSK